MKPRDRVELHPATDHWMRGDRFGEILRPGRGKTWWVALDRSGRTVRVHEDNIGSVDPYPGRGFKVCIHCESVNEEHALECGNVHCPAWRPVTYAGGEDGL